MAAYISFQPSDFFSTKLWTGTGAENAITGVGFQPDFTWIKNRDATEHNKLYDAVRGANKVIYSNLTNAEATVTQDVKSFDSDGFTLGTEDAVNASGQDIVGWNWKAGTTSGITTTGASIIPTSYSMSSTAGISIIKFTGDGVDGAKIAHGLGAVPELIISKRLENSNYWAVYHKKENNYYLVLNTTAGFSNAPLWKDTYPTSVYYQVDSSTSVNPSGETVVAYFFRSITGFSKVGDYNGNGNADGTFVYTGFKPAFIMIKRTDSAASWVMFDSERLGYNIANYQLYANSTSGEGNNALIDINSNGFKCRTNHADVNNSSGTYIYMAYAESPIVSSNSIPGVAR